MITVKPSNPSNQSSATFGAAHERFTITSVDGVERNIAVTAFPLFAHTDELVGTMTIWCRE